MIAFETPVKCKLVDVLVLSQKNRQPDDNPGAKLTLAAELSAEYLAYFDGSLRSFLFAVNPNAKQGALEGLEGELLTGIGTKIGTLKWTHDLTGYTVTIDQGMGGKKSNLVIADCALSGWKITPKEGGSVLLKFNVESADVSEAMFGRLAKLKSRELRVLMAPPEADTAQGRLDDDDGAATPKKAGKSVQDQFLDQHAPKH